MTTTTLSSKKRFWNLLNGMLWKNLSAAVYLTVALFLFFPLQMLLEINTLQQRIVSGVAPWSQLIAPINLYTSTSLFGVIAILLVATVVLGLSQCAYLHNKRAVDLYHSLPVTRTQLMSAGVLTTFLTVTVPFVLNYLVNLAASAYYVSLIHPYDMAVRLSGVEIFWDFFGWLVTVFAVLAVIFFVGTQVGSVFEHFVLSCELLLAPLAILFVNEVIFQTFLSGYDGNLFLEPLAAGISPIGFMIGRYVNGGNTNLVYNGMILLWLVLGSAILGAAFFLYRRRKSELAETSGCHGPLGLVLVAAAVYIAAPAIGVLISNNSSNPMVYVAGVLVGAVLTFLLFRAILNRGFAGMKKHLPSGLAICAFVTAVAVVVTTGGLGFETRVPALSKVKTAQLDRYVGWYGYVRELSPTAVTLLREGQSLSAQKVAAYQYSERYAIMLSSPESVELVRKAHQQLIVANQEQRKGTTNYYPYSHHRLQYELTNGYSMTRRFDYISPEVEETLMQLEASADFQQQSNPLLNLEPSWVTSIELYDGLGFYLDAPLPAKEVLLEALRKDAQTRGTEPFVRGEKIVCYLYIATPQVEMGAENPKTLPPMEEGTHYYGSFGVPVFESYANTLALLPAEARVPVTADSVTEMGISSEDNTKYNQVSGDRYLSLMQEVQSLHGKPYTTSVTYDREMIAAALEVMVTSMLTDQPTDQDPWLYCTFYRGKQTGITVMVNLNDLPEGLREDFPGVKERYEVWSYDDNGEA